MNEDKPQGSSWWQSMPGILTGVATATTALAGLVVALHTAGLLGSSGPPQEASGANTTAPQPESGTPGQQAVRTREITFEKSGGTANTQTSPQLDESVDFESSGSLKVKFEMQNGSCSSLRLHLYLEDQLVMETGYFDQTSGVLDLGEVPAGAHTLRVSPEGMEGKCNTGTLESWGGTLTMYLAG